MNPNLVRIGTRLGELFGRPEEDVTIAVTPAGAPPYYSRLRTLDMYGLSDRWIARSGVLVSNNPGHQRFAPFHYLIDQRVNLVIGTPRVLPRGRAFDRPPTEAKFAELFRLERYDPALLPASARIVDIPLDRRLQLRILYLVQNDVVDAVIASERLKTFPVPRY